MPDLAPVPAELGPAPLPHIAALVEEVKRCQAALDAAKATLHSAVTGVNDQLAEASALLWDKPPPVPRGSYFPRGKRLEAVKPLWEAGIGYRQVAKQLDMRPDNVRRAFTILEREKNLTSLPGAKDGDKPAAPPAAPDPVSRPRTRPREDLAEDEEEHAPDIEQVAAIAAEVKRQQGGMKGKKARLLTTSVEGPDGHRHIAEIDKDGDGITMVAGRDKHFHVVRNLVIRENPGANGHRHTLTGQPAAGA